MCYCTIKSKQIEKHKNLKFKKEVGIAIKSKETSIQLRIYNELLKFTCILSASQPTCQPVCRKSQPVVLGVWLQNFYTAKIDLRMKLLFQRTFIHCTMVLLFTLYYLTFVFKSLTER